MCWECISGETVVRLTKEQLEYLELPQEEQDRCYDEFYLQLEEEYSKLERPMRTQEPVQLEMHRPAPLSKWSVLRILMYYDAALFQQGAEAHLNAVKLLERYEQYTGRTNILYIPDWRAGVRDSAIRIDRNEVCLTAMLCVANCRPSEYTDKSILDVCEKIRNKVPDIYNCAVS